MPFPSRDDVLKALQPLKGLQFSAARNAAATKLLHFGDLQPWPHGGTAGRYSLHVQCAWRLTGPDGIVTGTDDRYLNPDDPAEPYDTEKYDSGGDLQAKKLADLFSKPEPVITAIDVDACGGITLQMSGGYVLQVLPTTLVQESWRLLGNPDDEHFVFPEAFDYS